MSYQMLMMKSITGIWEFIIMVIFSAVKNGITIWIITEMMEEVEDFFKSDLSKENIDNA